MSFVAFSRCWCLVLKVSFPSACLSTLHVSPEVRPWMLGAVKVNRVPHMGGTTSPDIAAKEKERAVNADHPARAPSCGPSSLLLGQDPQGSQTLATLCIASVTRGRGVLGSLLLGVRAHWWQGSCQPFRCCCPLLRPSLQEGTLCFAYVSKAKGSSLSGKTGTNLAVACRPWFPKWNWRLASVSPSIFGPKLWPLTSSSVA